MKINIKVFYQLIPSLLETMARRAQRTQNNKSAVSVWYFKKEERDKVYFMKLDQQKTFLQIDTFNFGVYDQSCIKYSKCQICNIVGVTEGKNPAWGYFFNGVSCQSVLQVNTIFCDKFGQAFPNDPENFALFLQCFKKEARNEDHFLHAGKCQSVP